MQGQHFDLLQILGKRETSARKPQPTHTHTHRDRDRHTVFAVSTTTNQGGHIRDATSRGNSEAAIGGFKHTSDPPPFPTLGSSRVPICSFQRCPWRSGFLLRGPRAQRLLRLLTLIPGLELGMQKQATPYTSSKRLSLRCFFRRRASVHVAIGPKAERRIFPTESFTRLSLCSSRCGTRAPSRASTSAGCRRFPHFRASA